MEAETGAREETPNVRAEHEEKIMELSAVIMDHAMSLLSDDNGAVTRMDFALLAFAVLHAGNTLKTAAKEEELWE